MSLYSLSLSGLSTAQLGLSTTSNNIDNADTAGYNRELVLQTEAGETPTSGGYVGQGVTVTTIQRQYDNFLYTQLVNSQSTQSQLTTQTNQITQINDLLGDNSTGISPALNTFFTSINAAATSPSDPAVREDLLGNTTSLVTQINTVYQQLSNQRSGLNDQISTAVTQVNSYLDSINQLNQEIVTAQNSDGGQPPNSLLDQRDQAVAELSQLVGVKTYQQGNSINITLNSGQTLLAGTTEYKLSAVTSSSDPSTTVVAYSMPAPGGKTVPVQLNDSDVTGGTLGGLLAFRSQQLDPAMNQLGQFAVGLAMTMNAQQEQGLDLNGDPGEDMFGMGSPSLQAGANAGNALLTMTPQSGQYTISFDGTNWTATGPDGTAQTVTTSTDPSGNTVLSFAGFDVTVTGTAQADDSWTMQPYSLSPPALQASSTNTGAATLTGDPENTDYKITANAATAPPTYTVVRESDGTTVFSGAADANGDITFHGVNINVNGNPSTGDNWTLQPLGMSGVPAIANSNNAANDAALTAATGTTYGATLTASYIDASALQASDYQINYNGGQYVVTRESDGTVFKLTPNAEGEIQFDGLSVSVTGLPAMGDSWELQPTRNAAGSLTATLTDPSGVALADMQGGVANGNNGLAMAQLQTAQVLNGGSTSLNEMYSQMVNTVGVQSQQTQAELTAQNNLITQQTSAQQNVSGVNLNQEYVNLTQYQEQYQASAKILDVANTIFDTLLGVATN